MIKRKYTVTETGMATCSCGFADCGDPNEGGMGYATVIDEQGKMFIHPFMDDKYSSPYKKGEILELGEDDIFEED